MSSETFQRARRPEQKEQRREAILSAAADLARRDGVRAVTLSDIARAVGIHKSALLRYFETREQIFLELTRRAWGEWQEATTVALGEVAPGDADTTAATLAQSFVERPLLCDLIPHTALNLERHASIEAVRAYKTTSLGAVGAVAGRCPISASRSGSKSSLPSPYWPARCTRSPPRRRPSRSSTDANRTSATRCSTSTRG
jgi:AcrR family transcriptional regulator